MDVEDDVVGAAVNEAALEAAVGAPPGDETAAEGGEVGNESEYEDGKPSAGGRRGRAGKRSFPRVTAILEDEQYLQGVLQSLEQSNCASQAAATPKNEWAQAFDHVYANVATDCYVPTGKNRTQNFKDKIVELWHTMEELVNDPAYKAANLSHPLFALAMKQLETYRGVATDRLTVRKTKAPGMSEIGIDDLMPSNKRSRPMDLGEDGGLLLRVCQNGFSRLEQVMLQQLPPKLPCPLQELHRLYLQVRARAVMSNRKEELNVIVPYYRDAVKSYLNQVKQRTNTSAHPALLHTILEGIDQLRQGPPPADMENIIRKTYKHVMTTYLKLIHPKLDAAAANPETSPAAAGDNDGVPRATARV